MMHSLKRALGDLGLLGVLSAAIGFFGNAVREKGAIKPTKDYFAKTARTTLQPVDGTGLDSLVALPPTKNPSADPVAHDANTASRPDAPGGRDGGMKPLQHDYQEIHFPEVAKIFQDPATAQGLNVFVDARKHDFYQEGHIPGALQCDPFEPDDSLEGVLARAIGAERVIVYCSGGDCEDSIFMCRELVEAGLPYESVFLYPGGWKEWCANHMPSQAGPEEQ